ncbi:MAG: peptidoglycan-binding protein [Geminicoccaceae bacterium]
MTFRLTNSIRCLFASALLWLALGQGVSAAERLAMVIGNANYAHTDALPGADADAQRLAAELRNLEYEVLLATDVDSLSMAALVQRFVRQTAGVERAVLAFIGHTIRLDDETYLAPVDAEFASAVDIDVASLRLRSLLRAAQRVDGDALVILDVSGEHRGIGRLAERFPGANAGIGDFEAPDATMVVSSINPDGPRRPRISGSASLTQLIADGVQRRGLPVPELIDQASNSLAEARGGDTGAWVKSGVRNTAFTLNPAPANRPPEVVPPQAVSIASGSGPRPLGIDEPSDPDGDTLIIDVTALPAGGAAMLDGRRLALEDALSAEELTRVTFEANGSQGGDVGVFGFRVSDGRGGWATGEVQVQIAGASNRPPVVEASRRLTTELLPLGFNLPSDPEGDPLRYLVEDLPVKGRVVANGRNLQVGDWLNGADIVNMAYVPEAPGVAGDVVIRVEDSAGAEAYLRATVQVLTRTEVETSLIAVDQLNQTGTGGPETDLASLAEPERAALETEAVEADAPFAEPAGRAVFATAAPETPELEPETPQPVAIPLDPDDVERVQTALSQLGYYDGEVDGISGPSTRQAIQQFQLFEQVEPTGSLDERALAKLNARVEQLEAALVVGDTSPRGLKATDVRKADERYELGWRYARGEGVVPDSRESVYWLKLAATAGSNDGLLDLGLRFARGNGVDKDTETAALLWQIAAARGEAKASYNLGAMFHYGVGVPIDLLTARHWYEIASESGSDDASQALATLRF